MKILKSLKNVETSHEPWMHHILRNVLTQEQIDEIQNAEINRAGVLHDGTRSGYVDGVEKQNHSLREYITKDNFQKYPELTKLIRDLQNPKVREAIAKLVDRDDAFEGSYIRLEVLRDTKSFWLKPHVDIPEKLISSLIYINQTDEAINLGTDLYKKDGTLSKTIPFEHNLGYIFYGKDTLHGVEPNKQIKVDRRGIQLNYVTFETDWPAMAL
jgi:ABC-type transport system substrate-binding protein